MPRVNRRSTQGEQPRAHFIESAEADSTPPLRLGGAHSAKSSAWLLGLGDLFVHQPGRGVEHPALAAQLPCWDSVLASADNLHDHEPADRRQLTVQWKPTGRRVAVTAASHLLLLAVALEALLHRRAGLKLHWVHRHDATPGLVQPCSGCQSRLVSLAPKFVVNQGPASLPLASSKKCPVHLDRQTHPARHVQKLHVPVICAHIGRANRGRHVRHYRAIQPV